MAEAETQTALGLDFRAMPKLELHAHLSGSICRKCLHEIWLQKKQKERDGGAVVTLRDPLLEMPEGKFDYDLETFFPLFSSYIYTLISDAPSIQHSTLSVLQDFASDGVIYLELRTTPRAIPASNITEDDYISLILSTITLFETTQKKMQTRLLLSIDRRNTAAQALHTVHLALKHRSPDNGASPGVVGLDFCGDPMKGLEAITTQNVFGPAFALARENNLPFTIHFAEAPQSATLAELEMLLSYGPSRLGHVIYVPLPPPFTNSASQSQSQLTEKEEVYKIYNKITALNIPLEILLSCNVSAKMLPPARGSSSSSTTIGASPSAGGYADHHFGHWYRHTKCPLALGTDDVGVFGAPLSREYELAVEHFGLGREEVLKLARGVVEVAFLGEDVKGALRERMW